MKKKTMKLSEKNGTVFNRIGRFIALLKFAIAVLSWAVDSLGNFPAIPPDIFRKEKSESGKVVDIEDASTGKD